MILSGFLVQFRDMTPGFRWLQWISLLKYVRFYGDNRKPSEYIALLRTRPGVMGSIPNCLSDFFFL